MVVRGVDRREVPAAAAPDGAGLALQEVGPVVGGEREEGLDDGGRLVGLAAHGGSLVGRVADYGEPEAGAQGLGGHLGVGAARNLVQVVDDEGQGVPVGPGQLRDGLVEVGLAALDVPGGGGRGVDEGPPLAGGDDGFPQ